MRKIILLSVLCLPLFYGCNKSGNVCSRMDDKVFKQYCCDKFDKNKDGKVSVEEANAVDSINVDSAGITSLKGIEYFPALKSLKCTKNKLTTLDISKNTALKQLICNDNKLIALDVSLDTALTVLCCSVNDITTLDVSKNPALESLNCSKNKLTSLDISKNTALTNMDCSHNELTTLDVSRNTALDIVYCNNNPNLATLWLKTNQEFKKFCFDKDSSIIKYKRIFIRQL